MGILLILLIFGACLEESKTFSQEVKMENAPSKRENLADAHNHIHGILPVDAIKVLLSNAVENWKGKGNRRGRGNRNRFDEIPQFLVKNANELNFSTNGRSNGVDKELEWLDSMDILCRIIVFSIFDIENKDTQGYRKKSNDSYCKEVEEMLLINSKNGRGMNSAGLLLSGCISLRSIMDHFVRRGNINFEDGTSANIGYLKDYKTRINGQSTFSDLFKEACLIQYEKGGNKIEANKWLFNRIRKIRDAMRKKRPERYKKLGPPPILKFSKDIDYLAKSVVTSSLSCSLWTPFEDGFALRALLRKNENRDNWIILSIKWLLENEVQNSNYLMELSVGLGNLDFVLGSLKKDKLSTFGIDIRNDRDLNVGDDSNIENVPLVIKHREHDGVLYLRFLSGVHNSILKELSDLENYEEQNIEQYLEGKINEKILADSKHSCWSGIDLLGEENFEYGDKEFRSLLTFLYKKLATAENSENRSLWLRPHIGHGAWTVENPEEKKESFCTTRLGELFTALEDFHKKVVETNFNELIINEMLEFVYRLFLNGWFPAYFFKINKDQFSVSSFRNNVISGSEKDISPNTEEERICKQNLSLILGWLFDVNGESWENPKKPKVRLAHVTYLHLAKSVLKDADPIKRKELWVDLNFGSDMISSSVSISNFYENFDSNDLEKEDVKKALERINKYSFVSSYDQTSLVANSSILGQFIKDIKNYGLKFVLGTDGQGVKSTGIKKEMMSYRNITDKFSEDEDYESIRKKHLEEYFKYCLGGLFGNLNEEGVLSNTANKEQRQRVTRQQSSNSEAGDTIELDDESMLWLEEKKIEIGKRDKGISLVNAQKIIDAGKEDILKTLVKNKVAIPGEGGFLNLATRSSSVHVCKAILEAGADINEKNDDGKIPIELAILAEKKELLHFFADSLTPISFLEMVNHFGEKKDIGLSYIKELFYNLQIKESQHLNKKVKGFLENHEDTNSQFELFKLQYSSGAKGLLNQIKILNTARESGGGDNCQATIDSSKNEIKAQYERWSGIKKSIKMLGGTKVNFGSVFGAVSSSEDKKFNSEVLADAHSHIYGILPVNIVHAMLSRAFYGWKDNGNSFCSIPEPLVRNAESVDLELKESHKWINSLDVLCRIIVISIIEIDKQKATDYVQKNANKGYKKLVKKMLFMNKEEVGAGRGMNGAGLLLSACISLRVLMDFHFKLLKRETNYFSQFRNFMNKKERSFKELFKAACILDYEEENANFSLNEDSWLFKKIVDIEVREEHREWIAEAAVTASMSSSLWAPFDDCYALRGLLRCDPWHKSKEEENVEESEMLNETNFIMLTLKWLIYEEAKGVDYFAEISISLGKLERTLGVICGSKFKRNIRNGFVEVSECKKRMRDGNFKNNLSAFGFEPVTFNKLRKARDLPLVLRCSEGRYKGKVLCLRFLTGFSNADAQNLDLEFSDAQLRAIERDAEFSCWAGLDMFGTENFVYGNKFKRWLNLACAKLSDISRASSQNNEYGRSLWLRPHVGEGAWAMDYRRRMDCFRPKMSELDSNYSDRGILWILRNKEILDLDSQHIYEILEFVYRSIFREWFPIFSINYGKREFKLKGLGEAMPNVPNQQLFSEDAGRIGATNLSSIIDWIKDRDVEKIDYHHPNIRFGHATHLNSSVLRKIKILEKLENKKKEKLWIDLNLGSNMVTSASTISSVLKGGVNSPGNYGSSIDKEKEAILRSPFTSGVKQTCLVARSKKIGSYIEKLFNAGIKFILGTDAPGAETTSIWTEIEHYAQACETSENGEDLEEQREKYMDEYIKYGTDNLDSDFREMI